MKAILKNISYLIFSVFVMSSCIPMKDLKYLQPSENTKLNEYGLITPEYETYRIKKDDVLVMTLLTSDENAAKFLTQENTTQFKGGAAGGTATRISGLIVDKDGYIQIYLLGEFQVLGKTLTEVKKEVQERLNTVLYNDGKAEVRINLAEIKYTMIGEIGSPGEKIEPNEKIGLIEAIAKAGDLTKFADRKNIRLIREYPEGKKILTIDITQENILNSPYYYLQTNDLVIINPRKEKISGLGGGTAVQDITQFLSLAISAISMYFFFKSL